MDGSAPSEALEQCRAMCKQLMSSPSLRRTPSDSDTVCVSSIGSLSSFSLGNTNHPHGAAHAIDSPLTADSSRNRVIFATRLLSEVACPALAPASSLTCTPGHRAPKLSPSRHHAAQRVGRLRRQRRQLARLLYWRQPPTHLAPLANAAAATHRQQPGWSCPSEHYVLEGLPHLRGCWFVACLQQHFHRQCLRCRGWLVDDASHPACSALPGPCSVAFRSFPHPAPKHTAFSFLCSARQVSHRSLTKKPTKCFAVALNHLIPCRSPLVDSSSRAESPAAIAPEVRSAPLPPCPARFPLFSCFPTFVETYRGRSVVRKSG